MVREAFSHPEMGTRFPAADCSDSHLLAMAHISPNGSIDASLVECYIAFHKRQITFHDLMTFHLFYQGSLSASIFRNDHQPRCILVKTMDDPRSQFCSHLLEIGIVGQQRVDQRILVMPWSWMDYLASRFIHDQQI